MASAALVAALAWTHAPRGASGAHDPPAAMDARRAYLAGVDLMNRNRRASEALPYFRRALGLRPDLWQVHCDYAAALINSVGEARPGIAPPRSITRSSWERITMIREGLSELDHAERLAAAPLDSAYVIAIRAQALAIWGLSWDGLFEYRRARRLDPESAELRKRRDQLEHLVREP